MTSFEIENVKNIYDTISSHFDVTRKSIWIDVKKFMDNCKKYSYVFDAGCGNGKNMYRDDCTYIGGDFCKNFLEIIKSKNKDPIQINVKHIPFKNSIFDYTICIAVIHHIKERIDRIKAISELIRVTKKGGKILISVWEAHKNYKQGDNSVKWTLQKKYNKNENNEDKIYNRYYYMFDENELYKAETSKGL